MAQSSAGRSRWGSGTSQAPDDALLYWPPSYLPCCCPTSLLHVGFVSSPAVCMWTEIMWCFLFRLSWVIRWCVTKYSAEAAVLGCQHSLTPGRMLNWAPFLHSALWINHSRLHLLLRHLCFWYLLLLYHYLSPCPCQEHNTGDLKETSGDIPVTQSKQSFILETDDWRWQILLTHEVFKVV